MTTPDGLPLLVFPDFEAFARWLEVHPGARGAWLKFAKKGAGVTTLGKEAAIDCALCHGWIDGQIRRVDDEYFLTRFTPRRPGARWSARNVGRVETLIAEGRMREAGLAEVEAAKADGRWSAAYPSAAAATMPPDLEAALRQSKLAARAFAALDGANRYALLYRLHHAKATARARKLAEFIAMLERGETLHPPRGRASAKEI